MKSFTVFEEYFDLITILPKKEEQQDLLYKIAEYMFKDVEPKLNDKQMKIFKNLKRPLDKSKEQSKRSLGNGAPKGNQNALKNKPKTNQKQTKNKPKTNTSMMSMSMSNVNVNKNNKFIKPSIEDIKTYCEERNNNIDANTFYDFYESKGWKIGNQKMKDWKACVRTWEKRTKGEQIVKTQQMDVPNWFDKEIKLTEGIENKEIKELIENYE